VNSSPATSHAGDQQVSLWKFTDIVLTTAIAIVASLIAGAIAVGVIGPRLTAPTGVGGYLGRVATQLELGQEPSAPGASLAVLMILQVPLWMGLFCVPWWLARRRKESLPAAIELTQKPKDIPLGLLIGAAAQLIMVPLIYLALSPLIDTDELSAPAREITDKANDPLGIVLLILVVLCGAPLVEEIFFRGVVYGALRGRYSNWLAILVSAIFFAIFHLQLLQLPALLAFGVLAAVIYGKTKRLGIAIWAHVGFNAVTVAGLLAQS